MSDIKKFIRRYKYLLSDITQYGALFRMFLSDISFSKSQRAEYIRRHALTYHGRRIALRRYGLKFTGESDVSEVCVDKIYSLYNDFIPDAQDIVVDVGAGYGDYSLLCAFYKANVYSFEPLPDNFKEIKKNIKLNSITTSKAFNVALSNKNYTGYIYYSGDMANKMNYGSRLKVRFRTLNSFKIKPTLLKIDVEGFELEVLAGARKTILRYKPKIIIETHSRALENSVRQTLASLGYKLVHKGRVIYNANKEFDKVTNLFFSY